MTQHIYNCYGECIDGQRPEFASESHGFYDDNGTAHVFWEKESEKVDDEGFDKNYSIEDIELPAGTKLARYGAVTGRTTTLRGTSYEALALPYSKSTVEYHEYTVIADGVHVHCFVTRGVTYGQFESKGGAIQFVHEHLIRDCIKNGEIAEETEWLEQMKKNTKKH